MQLRETLSGVRQAKVDRQLQKMNFDELPQLPRPDGYTPHPRKPVQPKFVKTETLRFGAGSRTKIRTPADLITKARRNAREAAIFRPGGSNLSRPTRLLSSHAAITTDRPENFTQVPAHMPSSTSMTQTDIGASRPANPRSYLTNEEKERRQKAIAQRRENASQAIGKPTNQSSSPKPTATSSNMTQPLSTQDSVAPTLPPLSSSGSGPRQLVIKKRPAADPLMPAKRRRIGQ